MREKKLNELPYDAEFLNALGELEMRIIEDYDKFMDNERMRKDFREGIAYLPGSKYLKIVTEKSLWGFINLKNKNFKEGDLLKGAGYNAPALNKPRGNIFDHNYVINWTGPKYLSGYCAGGERNGGLL
jgi:hypothetical protein